MFLTIDRVESTFSVFWHFLSSFMTHTILNRGVCNALFYEFWNDPSKIRKKSYFLVSIEEQKISIFEILDCIFPLEHRFVRIVKIYWEHTLSTSLLTSHFMLLFAIHVIVKCSKLHFFTHHEFRSRKIL